MKRTYLMTGFPGLAEAEIDAIITYINTEATKKPDVPLTPVGEPAAEDNSLLFGILALVLAIVALILLQINSNLKKLTDEKDGVVRGEPVAFWRNKAYIATGIILLFLVGGYFTIQGAIGLGRQTNYQPEQPIYYSHKVHAGVNQINCQYCHTGVYQGKQATLPSVNVCMNCHMAINEYKGEKMFTEDGEEVNGTQEIEKLYKYAGFEPGKPWDPSKAKPIEWVRIHNLPDHVYFNHSQHVKAGKVECQTCHGEIQKMGEVKQFSDLSMGWCINCHRETKVDLDNGYYQAVHGNKEAFQVALKEKGLTIANLGGLECSKCHY